MAIASRVLVWLRTGTFRSYILFIVLALLPVSAFIFAAHKLLLRQVTSRVVTQSSQTGRLISNLLATHLNESRVVVESFATRPSLIHQIESKDSGSIVQHLEQALKLRSDFEYVALYDLEGNLQSTFPSSNRVRNR